MNDQYQPMPQGGMGMKGVLLTSFLIPFFLVALVFLIMVLPVTHSPLTKAMEALGHAFGVGQTADIEASVSASVKEEFALALAQQAAQQDTLDQQEEIAVRQKIVEVAANQDQTIMQAKSEAIKGSYMGQTLIAFGGDLFCGLSKATLSPEMAQGCYLAEEARDMMANDMTQRLEENRPTGAIDIIASLPTSDDLGRDDKRAKRAAEIQKAIDAIKNG